MTQRLTKERERHPSQPPDRWLDAVRLWPDETARTWTHNVVEEVSRNPVIVAFVASGSSVRDVESSDDLDLVLVYKQCRPALPRPPISIDLRQYEASSVSHKLAEGHDYLSWTVRYGRVLFERDGWWTRLHTDWNDRLLLPSVETAKERARKAERLYAELCAVGDRSAAAELQISMLTQLARAALSKADVFPKSRPELVDQLRIIGEQTLADRLASALTHRYE